MMCDVHSRDGCGETIQFLERRSSEDDQGRDEEEQGAAVGCESESCRCRLVSRLDWAWRY